MRPETILTPVGRGQCRGEEKVGGKMGDGIEVLIEKG